MFSFSFLKVNGLKFVLHFSHEGKRYTFGFWRLCALCRCTRAASASCILGVFAVFTWKHLYFLNHFILN